MNQFMFATGIENSYPTIQLPNGKTKRVDELEKTGHYQHWEEDFRLVKESGIEFLRYGPPYYSTHVAPGVYDWHFTDLTFQDMKKKGITPIVDLCHFGVPDWLGDFQNPDFPIHFTEYARAFARRFPDLRYYTPINEIFITAMFSAQYGWWNERKSDEFSYVTALKNLCKANLMAMQAILEVQPKAIFIQSESCEYFHPEDPSCQQRADFLNEKRFLPLDLTVAYPSSPAMQKYLLSHGMTKEEYTWFRNNPCRGRCIVGTDYYMTNEHFVHPDGSTSASGDLYGYYVIAHQYYKRYRLPLMHTETNMKESHAIEWLKKQWTNLYRLKMDGVPVLGFTWYSLIDQVDWDTALREDNGRVNSLGMYDLNRKIRPLGEAYQNLIRQWSAPLKHNWTPSHLKQRRAPEITPEIEIVSM
jgi:beta-glucosidase/6-phospho-beta-glucosidase/beta-galactosidase